MFFIILILMSAMAIVSMVVIKDKLSRVIILLFLLWWTIWLGLSTFNFYELFSVSNTTYYLLLLNVMMISFGFFVSGAFKNKRQDCSKHISSNDYKRLGFLILLTIMLFILFYYYFKYMNIVSSGISSNIRMERFTVGNLFSSGPEIIFFNFFVESFMSAAIVVLAYMIIFGEIKNITFALLAASVFVYSGIGSGRGLAMTVLYDMILIFFIRVIDSNKPVNLDRFLQKVGKTKKIRFRNILFSVFAAVLVFINGAWLTALRMGYKEFSFETVKIGWEEFFRQGIVYYTGPFRALEYGLKVYPEKVGYLYGRGTFAGIDEIISMGFKVLGINYTSANGIIAGLLQNNQIQIGYNHYFNYAYTNVMIHYFDLGVLGVIFFSFFYGFFVRKAVFLYERKPELPTLIIMVFLFATMLGSVFSWKLQSPSAVIVIVGCYLWYKVRIRVT